METKMYDRNFVGGDVVRHFKGNFYWYVGTAIHTETGEEIAVYSTLFPPYQTYVRPMDMFLSEVDHDKYPNADQPYRMMKVTYPSPSEGYRWQYIFADENET